MRILIGTFSGYVFFVLLGTLAIFLVLEPLLKSKLNLKVIYSISCFISFIVCLFFVRINIF